MNPPKIGVEEARADGMYQLLRLLDKAKAGEVDKATALEWLKGHQTTIHQQGVLSERERIVNIVEDAYVFDEQYREVTFSMTELRKGAEFIKKNILKAITPLT